MAMVSYKKGRINDAIEAFKKTVEIAPDNAFAHYGLAAAYIETGKYGEAIKELNRNLRFSPHDKGSIFRLKYVPKLRLPPEKEIKAARTAAAKDSDNPVVHHWLAVVLILMNIPEGVVDELRKAISLDPKNAEYHYDLAYILDMNDDPGAIEELREALRIKPKYLDAIFLLGEYYVNHEKIDDAIRMFKKAAKAAPENALPHYYLGSIYADQGMIKDARKELKQSLKLDPDNFEARRKLAQLYTEDEQYDEAIGEYEKLVDMEPGIKNARESLEKLKEMKKESCRR
jgi:tetratricopeptide (TPR) repeat protein